MSGKVSRNILLEKRIFVETKVLHIPVPVFEIGSDEEHISRIEGEGVLGGEVLTSSTDDDDQFIEIVANEGGRVSQDPVRSLFRLKEGE